MRTTSSHSSSTSRRRSKREEPSSTAAVQIVREAVREGVSVTDLTRLAAADPAFALRVLSVANSSAYARACAVSDLQQAASLLGIRGLRNVALGLLVADFVPTGPGAELLLAQSLRRALACRRLASELEERDVDSFFTAGLLLESGLLLRASEELQQVLKVAQMPAEFRVTLETASGGLAHPERGAQLALRYGLPAETAEAIRGHHAPSIPETPLGRVCWLAEKVAGVFEAGVVDDARASAVAACAKVGLREQQVNQILAELPAQVAEAAEAFQRPVGEQLNLVQLRADAHSRLVQMNNQLEDIVRQLEDMILEKENLAGKLRAANEELSKQAATDPLTSLPNRRALETALVRDLARAQRDGKALSLVVVDVDHFKKVNDTYGHQAGDEVLKAVALELQNTARGGDVPARFGGEEFCIILPGAEAEGGAIAAERFRAAIEALRVPSESGVLQVTASFGVAAVPAGTSISKEALFERADQALYQAKESGRNRVIVSKAQGGQAA